MRTGLKLVLSLIVSVAVVSGLFAYSTRCAPSGAFSGVICPPRAVILGEALQESAEPLMDRAPNKNLQKLVERFGEREHLKGVAVYDASGKLLAITPGIAKEFEDWPAIVKDAAKKDKEEDAFVRETHTEDNGSPAGRYGAHPGLPAATGDNDLVGALALFHDTGYIDVQLAHTLRDSLLNALVQTLLITGLALILVRWTFMRPLSRTAHCCAPSVWTAARQLAEQT